MACITFPCKSVIVAVIEASFRGNNRVICVLDGLGNVPNVNGFKFSFFIPTNDLMLSLYLNCVGV